MLGKLCDDLNDSLNPILVKELRQQLRSNVFVGALFFVQVSMVFQSLVMLFTPYKTSLFFWVTISLYLFVLEPLRALSIVRDEYYQNTLDPLLLTRLSPRKIIIGKWCAVILQIIIFISSVLPYLIIRYLLGGEEILRALFDVTLLSIASIPFVSLMIAVSTNRKYLFSLGVFYVFIPGVGICVAFFWYAFSLISTYITGFQEYVDAATVTAASIVMSAFMLSAATKQDGSIFRLDRGKGDQVLILILLILPGALLLCFCVAVYIASFNF